MESCNATINRRNGTGRVFPCQRVQFAPPHSRAAFSLGSNQPNPLAFTLLIAYSTHTLTTLNAEKTFKSRFCEFYQCPENQFERAILLKVLHRRSLLLAWCLLRIHPAFFSTDYRILRQVGAVASRNNLLAEARDIRNDYQRFNDFGIMRRFLNLRISGKRLLAVANQVWSAK
jgi:hypothetical protein